MTVSSALSFNVVVFVLSSEDKMQMLSELIAALVNHRWALEHWSQVKTEPVSGAQDNATHRQTTLTDLPPIGADTKPVTPTSGHGKGGRSPVSVGGQPNHCQTCGALGRRRLNNSIYCKECKPADGDFFEEVMQGLGGL